MKGQEASFRNNLMVPKRKMRRNAKGRGERMTVEATVEFTSSESREKAVTLFFTSRAMSDKCWTEGGGVWFHRAFLV